MHLVITKRDCNKAYYTSNRVLCILLQDISKKKVLLFSDMHSRIPGNEEENNSTFFSAKLVYL